MTHTHHTVTSTDEWLASEPGRRRFTLWAINTPTVSQYLPVVLIGWAPLDALGDLTRLEAWLTTRPYTAPVFEHLLDVFADEWLTSDAEHQAFHEWAGTDAFCGGCWG